MSSLHDDNVPRIAVFGVNGLIGANLISFFRRKGLAAIGYGRNIEAPYKFDLARPEIGPLQLNRLAISHAIIAAAVSGIAVCQNNPRATEAINVTGTLELARQLHEAGITVVAFSSDYVFDGFTGGYDEGASVNPLNEYGRQKAELESRLPEVCGTDHLVLRLSKIYDLLPGSGTLLDEMAGHFRSGRPVRAAADQIFCPTSVDSLMDMMDSLIQTGEKGLFNLCAPKALSRLELARMLVAAFDADPSLVEAIQLADLREGFTRPGNTSMRSKRLMSAFYRNCSTVADDIGMLRESYSGWRRRT